MLNESVQTIESFAVGTSEPPADRRAQIELAIAEFARACSATAATSN